MSDSPYPAQSLHIIQCQALGIKGGGLGYPVFTEPEPPNVISLAAKRAERDAVKAARW